MSIYLTLSSMTNRTPTLVANRHPITQMIGLHTERVPWKLHHVLFSRHCTIIGSRSATLALQRKLRVGKVRVGGGGLAQGLGPAYQMRSLLRNAIGRHVIGNQRQLEGNRRRLEGANGGWRSTWGATCGNFRPQ